MSYDGYQDLQNAIVLRAADDYRILLKKQLKNPGNKEIARKIRKLEREIHTPFFQSLTRLDIDWLFGKIRDEILPE